MPSVMNPSLPCPTSIRHDPRPLHVHAPDLGRFTLIDTDRDGRPFAVVAEETRQ
jgi:hypothetical protein